MKFYSLCCLFFLLNFSPSFQSACEDVKNPSGFSDCKGKAVAKANEETCCFNKYQDNDGRGTECVEINKKDAFVEDRLDNVEDLIEMGNYWDDYTDKYNDVDLQCVTVSQCESVDDPDGYSSCKGKSTEFDSETCCFAKIREIGDDDDDEICVDIKKEDAEDQDKLNAASEKIKNGKYWDDNWETYQKIEIECGAEVLKGIFVVLISVLLI